MKKSALVFLSILCFIFNSLAQNSYTPHPDNIKNREWFQDAKFGLFIHWGVYATLADGEWIMRHRSMPVSQYEQLPAFFNPIKYDAEQWVLMAKNAGMKYITITSRHHDGFAMFDSKTSDYNIVKRTPYGKDILKPLAEACRKHGLKLFFYYSHLDWWHPDYTPRSNTSINANGVDWSGRPKTGNWSNYRNYMNSQLTELLTNYGDIAGIWFDGWWDNKEADWQLEKQYELIHKLQPGCLVGNNHHQAPKQGEDFQMFEKDLPGQNTTGFSGESQIGNLPLEMCETMNGSWGYRITDRKFKSSKDLIHLLVKNAGYNSNFLLNVGPQPDGLIQQEFVDTLAKIGRWMSKYGESIYGTRGGVYPVQDWGVVTKKNALHYIHVLKIPTGNRLFLAAWPQKPKSVKLLSSGRAVPFKHNADGLMLTLDPGAFDGIDLIIEVQL